VKKGLGQAAVLEDAIRAILEHEAIESKIERVSTSRSDVRAVVRTAVHDMMTVARERGVTLIPRYGPEPRYSLLDGPMAEECVVNVIRNAIRFSPEGGKVWVRLEAVEAYPSDLGAHVQEEQPVPLRVLRRRLAALSQEAAGRANFIVITVEDQGPGLPDTEFDLVFEEFASIPREGYPEGTGLGLSIARAIARSFGGEVAVLKSEVGVGTTFAIVLPISEEEDTIER